MSSRVSSRNISVPPIVGQQRKKTEASEYVSHSWIPISFNVLDEIKNNLEQGLYLRNPTDLLIDLKQDLGLYAWFLRKLPKLLHEPAPASVPTQIIEDVDLEKCKQLFNAAGLNNFPHQLKNSLKMQASSLKHAVISSVTAEAVAECTDVNPELAHLCAVIRQTGMSLVAWNYPRIFSRAVNNFTEDEDSIENELTRFLGCTPTSMAASICLNWDNKDQVKSILTPLKDGDDIEPEFEEEVNEEDLLREREERETRGKLYNCLELGDAMARLSDPEHFPDYAKHWQPTVERLKGSMGADALALVQNKLSSFATIYSSDNFDFNIDLEPRKNLTHTSIFRVTDRLMSGNKWIPKCSEAIQKKFRKIYTSIDKRGISTDAINILILEMIPALGFGRGCIYRFDEKEMTLSPLLRMGDAQLENFKKLNCTLAKDMRHPAVLATCQATPIIQEDIFVNNQLVSTIAGIFGESKKKAVVYVELSKKDNKTSDNKIALIHFKAIQKTLADCLNLE